MNAAYLGTVCSVFLSVWVVGKLIFRSFVVKLSSRILVLFYFCFALFRAGFSVCDAKLIIFNYSMVNPKEHCTEDCEIMFQ